MDLKEVKKQYELTGNFWNIKVMGEGMHEVEQHSENHIVRRCFALPFSLPCPSTP